MKEGEAAAMPWPQAKGKLLAAWGSPVRSHLLSGAARRSPEDAALPSCSLRRNEMRSSRILRRLISRTRSLKTA